MSWPNNSNNNNNFDPFAANDVDPFANLEAPTLLNSSTTHNSSFDPFGDIALTPERYVHYLIFEEPLQ